MRFYIGSVGSFAYGTATEIVDEVRFPADTPLESSAEGADAAPGGWIIDDPDGNYDVTGFRPAWVDEDDCTPSRVWTGFVTLRRYHRAPGVRVGPGRLIEVDLVDINHLLKRRVITSAEGKRPAELDSARIAWVLGPDDGPLNEVVFDNGLVDLSGPGIMLEEADYRDQYALDVLADCGAIAAKDFYLIWDETAAAGEEVTLVYEKRSATQRTADIGISNVLADQDMDLVWEPSEDSVLERTPEEVYSGVDLVYTGSRRIYLQAATTFENFFGTSGEYIGGSNKTRDLVVTSTRIGTEATAISNATTQLVIHSTERDVIETRLFLPPEKVNHALAGQSIVVRYTHFDGYETDTTMKIIRRSVIHPVPDPNRFYEVALRLVSGEASEAPGSGGGGGGTGGGGPHPPPPPAGCTPTYTNLASGASATATGRGALAAGSSAAYGVDGLREQGDPLVLFDQFADNHGVWPRYYNVALGGSVTFWAVAIWVGPSYTGGGTPVSFGGAWYTGADGTGSTIPNPTVTNIYSGLAAGFLHTFASPVTASTLCFSYVADMTGGFAVQAPLGFVEVEVYECVAASATDDPPAPGQWMPWAPADTVTPGATTTAGTTLFPYADFSLHVRVDGIDIDPTHIDETDPATGAFELDWVIDSDETVTVQYQGR